MSVMALEELRGCDQVFAEFYTSTLIGADVSQLEATIGRPIRILNRAQVEESSELLDAARTGKVAFVTVGDTMAATTHVDLRIQAEEDDIRTRIIHGVSIFSASASSLGLQPYKFGRTITLPFPEPGYYPISPYEHILENKNRGLHTLVLLDIREAEGRFMTAAQGIEWLLGAENIAGKGLFDANSLVCACARVGSATETVKAGRPSEMRDVDMGPPLHCLVVPGDLHFMEAFALVRFAGAPEDVLRDL